MLLADDLNAHGHRAYTREERLEAFEQLQVPPVASLSHATVIRLGQVVGATHVVIGSFTVTGGQIAVRARNIRLDTGRMENEIVESGPLEDLFAIFERVSRRIAGAAPASTVTARAAGPPGVRALHQGPDRHAPRRPRSATWNRRSSSVPGSTARGSRCGPCTTTRATVRRRWSRRRRCRRPRRMYARARFSVALSLIQLKRLEDAFATLRYAQPIARRRRR